MPDGKLVYVGDRHTAVIGERRRHVGSATHASTLRELAPFRSATGAAIQVPCDEAVTCTSTYTVSWTDADQRTASATLQSRCRSGQATVMEGVIQKTLARLGIAGWSRQTTRSGASSG